MVFLEPQFISYGALGLAILLLIIWIIRLERKLRAFTAGRDGKTLEDSIVVLKRKAQDNETFQREIEEYLLNVEERLSSSIQGVETIRFNPFRGSGGGSQSFATAFVNEKGDGAVLSSIYARDQVSIFAKPIKVFGSEYELSEEEKAVLKRAQESFKVRRKPKQRL